MSMQEQNLDSTNLSRLKECMRRAQRGEELTLGFFGGSITQDALASVHENCYARRVFRWWEDNFPNATFHYVNAGIGGTSSLFGAARVVEDLLIYQPDFVVVDFSVNDVENKQREETYEGVLRQILSWPGRPAVLLLNNIYYDTGYTDEDCHNAVGAWYGVPHVSIRGSVYKRLQEGEFTKEEITPDGLHPSDWGHELVAAEITGLLDSVKADLDREEEEKPMPSPLTANVYEHARRLTIRNTLPDLHGFRADSDEKKGHLDLFKNGWIGQKGGDSIRFEVEGSCVAAQYRKTVKRPALRAELVLDGDTEHPIELDGSFDEDWGDCLYITPVLDHGAAGKHTVEVRIPDGQREGMTPFYLVSLIVA